MKISLSSFFLIAAFLLSFNFSFAQEKISKSKIKKNINGVEYYVHTVQQGQTAFAIAKAYDIPLEDIYTANPGSETKIDLDQMLFIPTRPLQKKPVVENPAPVKTDITPQFPDILIYHFTQPGETIYRIAQSYPCSEQKIMDANPQLVNGLKSNQWIKLTVAPNSNFTSNDSLMFYTIQTNDSYKVMNDSFHVSQKKLDLLNPELKKNGFKKGETIKMSYYAPFFNNRLKVEEKAIVDNKIVVEVTESLPVNPIIEESKNCKIIKNNTKTYKIALMLPLYADQAGAINLSMPQLIESADKYKAFQFIQFYEGFLIAADSLAKMGMKIELSVYDTKADSLTTERIMDKPEMKNFDLIVGPFFTYNQRIVLREFKNTNTVVVNPFSKEMSLVKDNPKMFKLETEYTTQVFAMAKYISDSLPKANILIIHNGKSDELMNITELKKNFDLVKIPASQIHVFTYSGDGLPKYIAALKKGVPNILINVVNNEATITTFVRQLNKLSKDYDLSVFGSENRWDNFSMLEKEYLSNLKLLQFSSSFINYERSDVRAFVNIFADKYLTDPKDIAFEGFDIGYYFLTMLYRYDTKFTKCLDDGNDINLMHTEFKFNQQNGDAWQNTFVNIYQYNNYKLVDKKRPLPEVKIQSDER